MHRTEAQEILDAIDFKKMSVQDRYNCLVELWIFCDSEEWFDPEEFDYYPEEIRKDLIENEEPEDPSHQKYDFIIKDRMKGGYYGTRNEYLHKKLVENNIEVDEVTGEIEELASCKCCLYRTISPGEDGLCEICPVCFWENFGEGPNHMTIEEGRLNFQKIGAISQRELQYVNPEGKEKYPLGS